MVSGALFPRSVSLSRRAPIIPDWPPLPTTKSPSRRLPREKRREGLDSSREMATHPGGSHHVSNLFGQGCARCTKAITQTSIVSFTQHYSDASRPLLLPAGQEGTGGFPNGIIFPLRFQMVANEERERRERQYYSTYWHICCCNKKRIPSGAARVSQEVASL